LAEPIEVASFPIHHDVRQSTPRESYKKAIESLVDQLLELAPELLTGLTYMFNPREALRPAFFQIYRLGGQSYLYLVKIDLTFRPRLHEVIRSGSNDTSPEYRTEKLFLEADLIPLERIEVQNGRVRGFDVKQTISETWIGETGRGYFAQGIWLDRDLTKFFSKLFLPDGSRTYPYYPFTCKYRAVCKTIVSFASAKRKRSLQLLHKARNILEPEMRRIEDSLRSKDFSEENPVFQELRAEISPSWYEAWDGLNVEVYLNENEMREFLLSYDED
jgi:hypothetical protein